MKSIDFTMVQTGHLKQPSTRRNEYLQRRRRNAMTLRQAWWRRHVRAAAARDRSAGAGGAACARRDAVALLGLVWRSANREDRRLGICRHPPGARGRSLANRRSDTRRRWRGALRLSSRRGDNAARKADCAVLYCAGNLSCFAGIAEHRAGGDVLLVRRHSGLCKSAENAAMFVAICSPIFLPACGNARPRSTRALAATVLNIDRPRCAAPQNPSNR